jgi:hypothetical protein
MRLPRCVSTGLFSMLLCSQTMLIAGSAWAWHCCPCSNPQGKNCGWRGSGHCSSCRATDNENSIPISTLTTNRLLPFIVLKSSDHNRFENLIRERANLNGNLVLNTVEDVATFTHSCNDPDISE